MKRENMIEDLEMFLIELLEKERFEFLEPYMDAGEGCPANTLIGSPAKEILDFLEAKGMKPPCLPNDKCQELFKKYIDPDFNKWEE